jgi:hypothetical protein
LGWRFRKSFNPLPGIRLNFSPRGISTSVGAGPARLYLGSQGAAVTTRVPGTGIAYRQALRLPHSVTEQPAHKSPQAITPEIATPAAATATEIRSGKSAPQATI